jgi:DNA-binding NtrC family response regulator
MTLVLEPRGLVRSPAMLDALHGLKQAVTTSGGVLLCGEEGTGRGDFARAIHLATHGGHDGTVEELLERSAKGNVNGHPLVFFQCDAAHGLERRLFGCESDPGGASVNGLDRIAEGSAVHQTLTGTLVLQQVSELPGRLQARLARVLRDEEVWVARKDGGDVLQPVAMRPIAMLEASAGTDHLIPELRRRLTKTTITMPSLRQRREDFPALVRYVLIDICAKLKLPPKRASAQATALLSALPWPGNMDELRGLLRALVLKVPDRIIRQADVLANIRLEGGPTMVLYGGSLKQARARFEREYVASVLEQHHGRMTEAAKALGIQRTNLYRKVRQLSVKRRQSGQPA